jgi:glutaminyl-peptide cyclotransferase
MYNLKLNCAAFFLVGILIFSCGAETDEKNIPVFDGLRAFEYLEKQVSFGPRVPGSENASDCREYFIRFFDSLGIPIDTFQFVHNCKESGKPITMINILASFNPDDKNISDRYLLAAHYDSRPRAEYDSDSSKRENWIDGANDGASGVAVLMELANLMASQKPRVGVDLILLDGEDYGRPGDLDEYFLGAKDFVKRNIREKYDFALVIDMIGDADLKIYKEEHSNKYSPEITDLVWQTAAKLGETAFVDSIKQAIQDDHLSFMTINLQSAVIIDFDYKYWHTTQDNVDKCSAVSLQTVGRVITKLIYEL